MEGYALRGVPDQQRTRSNSTVSAGSMGGLAGLDGASVASKVGVQLNICGTIWFGSGSPSCVRGLVYVQHYSTSM